MQRFILAKYFKLLYLIIMIALTLFSCASFSQLEEIPPVKKEKSVIQDSSSIDKKESTKEKKDIRQNIYKSAVDFANWIDRFFGEPEELEIATYDSLRFTNEVSWRDGDSINYKPKIKAKVHLPKVNKKLSILFSDREDDDLQDLQRNNDILRDDNDERLSASVNYKSEEYYGSQFDTRIGIRSSFESFAIFKHTLPLYKSETVLIRNFNYFFWREKEKFGVNPRLEFDKIVDHKHLFRWKYSILRSETSEGNEWQNTFSWIRQIKDEVWISYDFGVSGKSEQPYDIEAYRIAVRYRTQLPIKWLYFEIEPELLWLREPESIEREFKTGIILRLDVEFGE